MHPGAHPLAHPFAQAAHPCSFSRLVHPRSHRIAANGVTLRVLEWPADGAASASAPAMVIVHGWMDSGATFDLVAPRLAAAGFRVLAPDMRGFGESDPAPAGSYYHFPDYVADLAALVDHVLPDGSPFTLVGHSMGGSIASLYASARPARVERFVNIEGLGPPAHGFTEGAGRLSTWLDQLADSRFGPGRPSPRAMMLRRLCTGHPTVTPEILDTRLDHLIKDGGAGENGEGASFVWKADVRHRMTGPTPFFAELFKAHAARIEAPVLFVAGGATGYHPEDEADRLTAFRDLRTVTIPDAGHMIHWTHPDLLASHILAFVRPAGTSAARE